MAPATVTAYCMLRVYNEVTFDVSRDDSEHGVDEGETGSVNLPYYKVNDERLCRSTQWVVSLNTALSPSSCMVIRDKEYNHTLGSLTPLDLVTHPDPSPGVTPSSGFPFGICIER